MFFYGSFDSSYLIYMILSCAISFYAQCKVNNAFKKYSNVFCKKGISGQECAEEMLKYNNINDVSIRQTGGEYSDYFDPRTNEVHLSEPVYSRNTITAVSVAAHECGHATQHHKDYWPIKIRSLLVPVCSLASNLSMPLVLIGMLWPTEHDILLNLGIMLFSFSVLFHLVTLPVEFDASKRALESLKSTNTLSEEEIAGAKEVLSAAAFTYVAAMFDSLLFLLRLVFISSSRRKK